MILEPPLQQVFKTLELQQPKCFICEAVYREVLLNHRSSIFQGKYPIPLGDLIVSINYFKCLYEGKLKILQTETVLFSGLSW